MTRDGWKVGELAGETGLTVRTLNHYDEIGLLKPSRRTQSGHRLYGEADVTRLQQVTSLRQLGLPLEQIRDLLARRGVSPREIVGLHLARVREQIELQRSLCERLERIAKTLEAGEDGSPRQLLPTHEGKPTYEKNH